MCSCHRDGKPQHTEACRKAHERWNHSPQGYVRRIAHKLRQFEKETGVKP